MISVPETCGLALLKYRKPCFHIRLGLTGLTDPGTPSETKPAYFGHLPMSACCDSVLRALACETAPGGFHPPPSLPLSLLFPKRPSGSVCGNSLCCSLFRRAAGFVAARLGQTSLLTQRPQACGQAENESVEQHSPRSPPPAHLVLTLRAFFVESTVSLFGAHAPCGAVKYLLVSFHSDSLLCFAFPV